MTTPPKKNPPPRVLIMDDDTLILRIGLRLLQFLGYEADSARDGSEALKLYKNASIKKNPFNAVLIDLSVPVGMGGKEMMKQLLEFDPEAKGIVATGHSSDPAVHNPQQFGFSGVIAKPFKIEELASVLETVIGKQAHSD